MVAVAIAQTSRSRLQGDPSVGEPLWTWIKSTPVTSVKHGGRGATTTITAKMEFVFEERRFGIVV